MHTPLFSSFTARADSYVREDARAAGRSSLTRSDVQGLNVTRYSPMGCAFPNTCCKLNQQSYRCGETAASCNVCPECCHDEFKNPTACSRCVETSCGYMNLAQYGCQVGGKGSCCTTGQQNASTTLNNCLIIGKPASTQCSQCTPCFAWPPFHICL